MSFDLASKSEGQKFLDSLKKVTAHLEENVAIAEASKTFINSDQTIEVAGLGMYQREMNKVVDLQRKFDNGTMVSETLQSDQKLAVNISWGNVIAAKLGANSTDVETVAKALETVTIDKSLERDRVVHNPTDKNVGIANLAAISSEKKQPERGSHADFIGRVVDFVHLHKTEVENGNITQAKSSRGR